MTKDKLTYIITLAKKFPGKHPKKGEPTGFKQKYLCKEKIHTIRANYDYWAPRLDKVNAGEAVLKINEWSGRPYYDPQSNIDVLTKVGYQKIDLDLNKKCFGNYDPQLIIDGKSRRQTSDTLFEVSKNDGFSEYSNFMNWFPKPLKNGIIIHFTDFKY